MPPLMFLNHARLTALTVKSAVNTAIWQLYLHYRSRFRTIEGDLRPSRLNNQLDVICRNQVELHAPKSKSAQTYCCKRICQSDLFGNIFGQFAMRVKYTHKVLEYVQTINNNY